ncbi:Inversin, partial [Nibea albiflora]
MAEEGNKLTLRRLEAPIHKFIKVALPTDLERLQKHHNNILKYQHSKQWDRLHQEQINASRTVQQLRANIREMEKLCARVRAEDAAALDELVKPVRDRASAAARDFLLLHSNPVSQPATPAAQPSSCVSSSCPADDDAGEEPVYGRQLQLRLPEIPADQSAAESWDNLEEDLKELSGLVTEFSLLVHASATSSTGPVSLGSQVHAAAVNGDRSTLLKLITEILLKAGASVNKTDHSQRTALHLAAQKGNVRFLKLLLSRRANWLQKDLEEMTPLHLATRHPSPKALALLLKHIGPGEVDTQDKNKQTALHWSAFYNRPEHVRLLIKHDSNIGIPDSEGKIPLHWAAHSQEPSATQTVRCILEAAPTESLLNWQDYEGRTPLHFAVADGNEAVVEVLTSYEGCNVTAYDNLFRTPLHWAALLGHARIVHLLLERNTSGTIPSDSQGATPLHYGAQSNNADEPDLEGRTAFMWAAGKGSDDVIRTMLALTPHIDINMADKYGGTG